RTAPKKTPNATRKRAKSSARWWLATRLSALRAGARFLRIRAGVRGRSFLGRFLRAMARTSPRVRLALPEHAFGEALLDGALRHPPVPRVEEHELVEAGVLPPSDEVVPGVFGTERCLGDERVPDERRPQHLPARLGAELVQALVVPAALRETFLCAEA